MEPVTEKILAGDRFWPVIVQKLTEAGISKAEYCSLIGRETKAPRKTYHAPRISEMPVLFDFLKTSPAKIFDEIGNADYLLPGTRDLLETFERLDSKTLRGLTEIAGLSVGSWMYDCRPYNPVYRLLLCLEHHVIPQSADDHFVYEQKLKYRQKEKSEVPEEEMTAWIIGNSARLRLSTINFDIEQWVAVAGFLKVSVRWLYNYDRNSSFYGYRPEAETLYDIWSLATEPMQKMIAEVAAAKVQEVSTLV